MIKPRQALYYVFSCVQRAWLLLRAAAATVNFCLISLHYQNYIQ